MYLVPHMRGTASELGLSRDLLFVCFKMSCTLSRTERTFWKLALTNMEWKNLEQFLLLCISRSF